MAMALQNVGGRLTIPHYPSQVNAAPSFTTTTVDADGEGYGMVFQAPATGTITGAGLLSGATHTTGDANTLIRLESVLLTSTPGIPNGIIAANVSGLVNVAAANTWYNAVFTAGYAAQQGELIAVTLTRQAGGSLNSTFRLLSDQSTGDLKFPYAVTNVGAGWVANAAAAPIWAINYGGTYYTIDGAWPLTTITTNTFGSGSSPDVIGNVWIPRFNCRVVGVWVWMDLDGPVAVKFYDTDGVTVLAQGTAAANSRTADNAGIMVFPFDDVTGAPAVTPTVGSTYRIGVEPSSATTLSIYDITVDAAAVMDSYPLGQNFYRTQAKDPTQVSDWTDAMTRRVLMGLIIDQLDDGVAAGGGLLTHPGMSGGMRG